MTRFIQIIPHYGGRYRYTIELVDEAGEVRHRNHFFTEGETVNIVDFLLRLGFPIAGRSEGDYLQLMQHPSLQ